MTGWAGAIAEDEGADTQFVQPLRGFGAFLVGDDFAKTASGENEDGGTVAWAVWKEDLQQGLGDLPNPKHGGMFVWSEGLLFAGYERGLAGGVVGPDREAIVRRIRMGGCESQ